MGSAATSMSTVFSKKIDISPPRVELLDVTEEKGTDRIPDDEMLVKVSFNLKVGELIDSSIMQLYPLTFAKDLISSLMNSESAEEEETVQPEVTYEQPKEPVTPEPRIEPKQQQQPPKRQGTAKKQRQFRFHRWNFPRLIQTKLYKPLFIIWICFWISRFRLLLSLAERREA